MIYESRIKVNQIVKGFYRTANGIGQAASPVGYDTGLFQNADCGLFVVSPDLANRRISGRIGPND